MANNTQIDASKLKPLFLINAIVEIIGGIVIAINPALMFYNCTVDSIGLNIAKIVGVAALVLGIVAYQLYRHEITSSRGVRMIALGYLIYHLILALISYSVYQLDCAGALGPMSLHLFVGLVSAYFYMRAIPKSNA